MNREKVNAALETLRVAIMEPEPLSVKDAVMAAVVALAGELSVKDVFAIADAVLAQNTPISRDLANVLGVLQAADFGVGTATPPVTVIRSAIFPKTRNVNPSRLQWDFSDGTDIVPKADDNEVVRKHLKAAARGLGMTYMGQTVPYDQPIVSA